MGGIGEADWYLLHSGVERGILTPEEIALIEESTKYRYGEV